MALLQEGGIYQATYAFHNRESLSPSSLDQSRVFVMGRAGDGQLGLATSQDHDARFPVEHIMMRGRSVRQVSTGGKHSLAVTESGDVFSWGWNWCGQLGTGDVMDRVTPSIVKPFALIKALTQKRVVGVAAGAEHSLALMSDGTLYAWGGNDHGELGQGSVGAFELSPKPIFALRSVTVTKVVSGGEHNLCLTDSGSLFVWGKSGEGRLGLPVKSSDSVSTPRELLALMDFKIADVACGANHTLCATTTGLVFAWGNGEDGRLGLGDFNQGPPLISVPSLPVPSHSPKSPSPSSPLPQVEALPSSPKSLVVEQPRLVTWFRENYIRVVKVSAGFYHSAALDDMGRVYTWGWGEHGQLGHGDLKSVWNPREVEISAGEVDLDSGLPRYIRFVDVLCGGFHTVLISSDGSAYAFGLGQFGELGVDLPEDRMGSPLPVLIKKLSDHFVYGGSCGWWHTLLLARSLISPAPSPYVVKRASLLNEPEEKSEAEKLTSSVRSLADSVPTLAERFQNSVASESIAIASPKFKRAHRRSESMTPASYRASYDSHKSASFLGGDDSMTDSSAAISQNDNVIRASSSFAQDSALAYDSLRNFKHLPLPRAKSFVDPPPLLSYAAIMGQEERLDKQLQDIEEKIGTPVKRAVDFSRLRNSGSHLLVDEPDDEPRIVTPRKNLAPILEVHTPEENPDLRAIKKSRTAPNSTAKKLVSSDGAHLSVPVGYVAPRSASTPTSPSLSPRQSTSKSNPSSPRSAETPNILEQAALALANLFFDSSHKRTVSLNRVRAKSRMNDSKAKQLLEIQASEGKEEQLWINDILPNWETKKDEGHTKTIWERGLPTAVRGLVWSKALGNPLEVTPEKFALLLAVLLEEGRALRKYYLEDMDPDDSEGQSPFRLIQVDLPRTFAHTKLFEPGQPLHLAVTEILEAVSLLCPDVGYVQGMSYVSSMLLLVMDQFEAFVAMSAIINHPFFTSLYIMDVRQIVRHIKVYDLLFAYNLPRLFQRFQEQDISPEHYLLDWFLTIFSKAVPTKIASRIWDCFMLQGEVFLFVTALGILRHNRKFLHAASFEQCITKLKDLAVDVDEAELFNAIGEIEIPDYVHEFIRRLNTIHLPSTTSSSSKSFPHLTNLIDSLIDKTTSSKNPSPFRQ